LRGLCGAYSGHNTGEGIPELEKGKKIIYQLIDKQ
jgi:hypothetical protein